MIEYFESIEFTVAEMRRDWDEVKACYDAYRAVLIEAGVPMHLDEEGNPAREGPRQRDLIDGIRHLAERCREAEQAARDVMHAIPERCPITGAEFSRIEEHPERGWVALYAGPDSAHFSIPDWGDSEGRAHDRPLARMLYDSETKEWFQVNCTHRMIAESDLDQLKKFHELYKEREASYAQERDKCAEDLRRLESVMESSFAAERTAMAEQLAEARRREQLAVDQAQKAEIERQRLLHEMKAAKEQHDVLLKQIDSLRANLEGAYVQFSNAERERDQERQKNKALVEHRHLLSETLKELVEECEACWAPWHKPNPDVVARAALNIVTRNGEAS